jgi:hypothetical protein
MYRVLSAAALNPLSLRLMAGVDMTNLTCFFGQGVEGQLHAAETTPSLGGIERESLQAVIKTSSNKVRKMSEG